MNQARIEQHRHQKNAFFKSHPQSPLTPAQQAVFTGLAHYEYNPDLDLTVAVEPFETPKIVQILTTDNQIHNYLRYAEFTFTVDSEEVCLTIFRTEHGFFLPFVDANAGKETYPAGRYLEPEQIDHTTFHIDFNLAYNPFCAYNDAWSCPITPFENRLKVAIRAGEKIFPQIRSKAG